ncbi:hypothetical protein EVAR_23898_1 [Eumeta japonica]|uniref:Uncharacterized protein n=1 Tax=Eumeta variegata TaxID=151549 RepID=A0A4C1V5J1_EUMVA|nr:hypothetical protein EVAR_23898_1 [Eumeta japonica]
MHWRSEVVIEREGMRERKKEEKEKAYAPDGGHSVITERTDVARRRTPCNREHATRDVLSGCSPPPSVLDGESGRSPTSALVLRRSMINNPSQCNMQIVPARTRDAVAAPGPPE